MTVTEMYDFVRAEKEKRRYTGVPGSGTFRPFHVAMPRLDFDALMEEIKPIITEGKMPECDRGLVAFQHMFGVPVQVSDSGGVGAVDD